jgi:nucleoid DNA-binding protein
MNKEELIKAISTKAKVSEGSRECLNATTSYPRRSRGHGHPLVSALQVRQRAAREGRNPALALRKIPAKSPVWTAGKTSGSIEGGACKRQLLRRWRPLAPRRPGRPLPAHGAGVGAGRSGVLDLMHEKA